MRTLFSIARSVGVAAAVALVGVALMRAPAQGQSADDALKVIDQARGAGADKGRASAPVAFVPPPRTIDDITAILDRQKPDPAKLAANRAIADGQPPAGADAAALADFYFKRGLA